MVRDDPVREILEGYPRIFFACHTRHVLDPKTRRAVSAHQASVLDHLDTVEPTSLAELARHMGVTPSTMCITIERLVRHGYVERRRNTGDRRRAELRLSAAGDRLRRAQSVLDPPRVAGMLAAMPDEERARGLEGLRLLARAADAYMATKPAKLTGVRPRRARRSR